MGDMTTGELIFSVVGFAVGSFWGFGGAMLGMSLGGQLGSWIDPPDAPAPPPLGDVGVNTYIHNAPVTLAYGQNKIFGGAIWIGDAGTSVTEGGSKKSPTYTANMYIEFAIAHCEGEAESVEQYWINDQTLGELQSDGLSFDITTYLGTSTQIVNAAINSYQSGKDTPAIPFKNTVYSYIYAFWAGGSFSSIPTVSGEFKNLLVEEGEEDANPIRVLHHFLTDQRVACQMDLTDYFDDETPDTPGSDWETEADYCDEIVTYIDENDDEIEEPRFRFSNHYDSRVKGFDIIRDILSCCNGVLVYKQGKIIPKIQKEDETPTFYYSDEHIENYTTTTGSTVNRIELDTTISEPFGYWEGAFGKITISGTPYKFVVLAQGTDYIDLCEDLLVIPGSGIEITLTKDNIKEGSFVYNSIKDNDIKNRTRLEFLNRKFVDASSNITNSYQTDIVEWESPDLYAFDEEVKEQTTRMFGIKRKSQAMRTVKHLSDSAYNCKWYCEFVTDIVGFFHCVSDVIGVTHTITGWERKYFRIMSLEELENNEVKIYCLEYNSDIYNAALGVPVITSSSNKISSPLVAPDHIERFNAVQDETENKVYLLFKKPDDNPYWVAGQIYLKKGTGDWEYINQDVVVTPSIKLSAGIDNSQTTIPFDESTLYGAFPTTGSFWIEEELISYTNVNYTLDQFEGCTRGTSPAAHTIDKYCSLKQSIMPYISFEDSDIGSTWYFRIVSINHVGAVSEFSTAPEDNVVLS